MGLPGSAAVSLLLLTVHLDPELYKISCSSPRPHPPQESWIFLLFQHTAIETESFNRLLKASCPELSKVTH